MRAEQVAELLAIKTSTVYELSLNPPFGLGWWGRCVVVVVVEVGRGREAASTGVVVMLDGV
jgi:hypothetical protein